MISCAYQINSITFNLQDPFLPLFPSFSHRFKGEENVGEPRVFDACLTFVLQR